MNLLCRPRNLYGWVSVCKVAAPKVKPNLVGLFGESRWVYVNFTEFTRGGDCEDERAR